MFFRRQSKLVTRKKFEERVWKKEEETFYEYFHEKVIMGNRVPINDDEMLEYVIDGTLRNQARIQRFTTADGFLETFGRVILRDRSTFSTSKSAKSDKRASDQSKNERKEMSNSGEVRRFSDKVTHCYNCGEHDHVSLNCPSKEQGVKCFQCGERGHIASKCVKKVKANKENCAVSEVLRHKYLKGVLLDGHEMEALIDWGSDFSLIRADEYIKLGLPQLRSSNLLFDGIGSSNNATLGKFQAELTVDEHSYPVCIHVVSDTMLRHKLLILIS
ncbi:hypothetical protein ALC57_17858 [Trachymyrmex cornetzi]|uniref:CCHC-type domain-containing protein n=1 Tax=Trachymyrmex cornetzi TaxID=471704 RepID=A0A151IT32_9HYME|nr:hypothetical protein ALC57_17858 [Trachymyrmex cornetzi]